MNRKERRANKGKNKGNGKGNGSLNLASGMQVSQTSEGKTKVSIPVQQSVITNIKDRDQYLKDFAQAQKFVENDNLAEATQILSNLLKQHPRDYGVIELLAISSEKLKNYQAAIKFFKAAKELQPGKYQLDICIANLLIRIDEIEEGVKYAEQILKDYQEQLKDEEKATLHGIIGNGYMLLGDHKKAKKHLKAACDHNHYSPEHLYNYVSQVGKPKEYEDIYFQRLREIETKKLAKTSKEKTLLQYALFDCYDSIKEHEKAFNHAIEGAELKRKEVPFDTDIVNTMVKGIKDYFTKEFYKACEEEGCPSDIPVFIIGMPRSGTTLLEQILQAHPDVGGVGEDAFSGHMIKHYSYMHPFNKYRYPLRFSEEIQGYYKPDVVGRKYTEYLEKIHPDMKRVINKAIGNMLFLGYLHIALPNCKFIHIKRNAMDSCLSAFTKNFIDDSQSYSYDMTELGTYYKNYVELMEHWNNVLPGKILNIEYEQIVDDLEEKAREVIDFIELPWNDACLDFHKADNVVRTASITQVRKPIYKSAMNRWKRYGPQIAPLIKALGHAAPPEAQEYLKTLEEKTE